MKASPASSFSTLVDDESISAPVRARMLVPTIGAACDWIIKVAGLAAAILFGVWAPISYNAAKDGNASNDEAQRLLLEELKTMTQIQISLIAEIKAMNNKISEMNEEMKNINLNSSGLTREENISFDELDDEALISPAIQPKETAKDIKENTEFPASANATSLLSTASAWAGSSYHISHQTTSSAQYPQTTTPLPFEQSAPAVVALTMHNATSHFQPPWVNQEWIRDFTSTFMVGMTAASLLWFAMHMGTVLLKHHQLKSRGHVKQSKKAQATAI